ncbi:hypothetical protein B0T09DRAFT_412721 [Sordaria sp. MPI-SDFR-AT-0083]|nr:hypothetical protein B0T09DRAFT_412721 [Sordaria sp. MPI-SDFR-AT-0083]
MSLQDGTLPDEVARPKSVPNGSEWAILGGIPSEGVDIPISSVFILLFAIAAAWHLYTYFAIDRRRLPAQRHFFAIMLVVFSMLRILSLIMRIIWAASVTDPHISEKVVAVPARAFTTAGNTLIYILNFLMVRRLNRDYALFGSHPAPLRICRFLMFATLACLVMVITSLVDSYHVHTGSLAQQGRAVQLAAFTILTVLAFSPVLFAVVGHAFRDTGKIASSQEEKRRYKARLGLVLISALLMTLDVGYECGVAYRRRPVERPAWWHHRAALYLSDYLLELLMTWIFAVARVDGRFSIRRERLESRDGSFAPPQRVDSGMTMGMGDEEVRRYHGQDGEGNEHEHEHDYDHGHDHDHDHDHDGFWKEVHMGASHGPHVQDRSGRKRFVDRINTDEDIFGSG